MRHGTLNVPGIVGMGKAAEIARETLEVEKARITALRNRFENALKDGLEEVYVNGHPTQRLPGALNMSFNYIEGESLMMGIGDIACSSGSACTSASLEPSYVLKALGVGDDLAHSSLRLSLGRWTTEEEVEHAIEGPPGTVSSMPLP